MHTVLQCLGVQSCPVGFHDEGEKKRSDINGGFDYSPVTNVADMKDKKRRWMTSTLIRANLMASPCSGAICSPQKGSGGFEGRA